MIDLCAALVRASPSVMDVLAQNARHTVCTSTQCFESLDDVAYLALPPSQTPAATLLVVCGAAVVCALITRRRAPAIKD
jgi:hypothetical protein